MCLGVRILIWLSYIFTKAAMQKASVFTLLGWRFIVAAIIAGICIYFRLFNINLKEKLLNPLLLISLFNPCIYFICETIGIIHTNASEIGVFLSTIPVASLIASVLYLKNNPYKVQVIGIFITLLGVMFTILSIGVSSSLSITGYICLFTSVVSYALFSVCVAKRSNYYTEFEITFIMLVTGAVIFGTLAICEAMLNNTIIELFLFPFTEISFFIAILYQGIGCSILAFFLYNVAISKIGVNRTSSFIGIATVVSIISGAFLLDEVFSIYHIFGALIIIAGVYIANFKIDKKQFFHIF